MGAVDFAPGDPTESDIHHAILNNNNDDLDGFESMDSMDSMESVDSVDEDVVIDGEDDEVVDIPSDGLVVGLTFKNENSAVNSILKWSNKTFCPLIKARRDKPNKETEHVEFGVRNSS